MSATLTKNLGPSVGLLLTSLLCVLLAFANEMKPLWSDNLLYCVALLSFAAWWFASLVRTTSQAKIVQRVTTFAVVGVSVLLLLHFTSNIVNIYQYEPLPTWFYTFKVFRLITITGTFWAQLYVLLIGIYLILTLETLPKKLGLLSILLWLALLIPVTTQLYRALGFSYLQAIQMTINAHIPFDDRFTYKLGGTSYYGWIWPYAQFLKKHTTEQAVIVIPTQNNIWKMEGNEAYFRWFMYPRTLVHMENETIPENATHMLIALGECDNGACGWPKISIPAERIESIILIDRDTQEETVIENTAYALDTSAFQWGIIELK